MKASWLSCLVRSPIAHPPERRLVVGPSAAHPDPDLQVDLASEELLHVEARRGGDFLELGSARADHDRLVSLLFDDDGGMDAPHPADLLELLDLDVGAIGKLLAQIAEELLAQEFRREITLVPVRDLVGGMDRRLLRQVALQGAEQLAQPLAAARAHRDDLVELRLAGRLL